MELILITGMSGSGKSVALHALEDAGYYCVDNLPPELLLPFMELEERHKATRVAIAVDVRSAASLPLLPDQLEVLCQRGVAVKQLFLDASADTLVRRFSETRRKHPLSQAEASNLGDDYRHRALLEAIELERSLLADLRVPAHVMDSSHIRAAQLQEYVKAFASVGGEQLTLVFESFAFKRGVPSDADYVFDARMLPNPFYEPALRGLSGLDAPVKAYLQAKKPVGRLHKQVAEFLESWLDDMVRDHRSYVTVAIGCTGGQHRSVYLVEQLALHFSVKWVTLRRHRELDGQSNQH